MKVAKMPKPVKPKTLTGGVLKKKPKTASKVLEKKLKQKVLPLVAAPSKKPAKQAKVVKDKSTKDSAVKHKSTKDIIVKDKKKSLEKPKQKEAKAKGKPAKKPMKSELEGLKAIDPEFYNFLQQNDKKLLDFNLFDSDDDDDDEDMEDADAKQNGTVRKNAKKQQDSEEEEEVDDDESADDDEEFEGKYHKPADHLDVASDESDFEDADADNTAADGMQKVTLNLLRQWEQQLQQKNVSIDVLRKVIQAFSSALASITGDGEQGKAPTEFKVVGAAAFNGVVQLCIMHLQPAVMRFVGLTPRSTMPLHKTKKWLKVRSCLRYYLTDLIHLIEQVSGASMLGVLLKHLHQLANMVASFSTLGKTILKRLIGLWSAGDETVRVLAFLCILKITRCQQVSMLHHVLKAMYLAYVRNSKFVSPNTLPGINFMRRSLVEMFALDLNVSYQHAFLYIRQLAIHLRNAVILKKKDSFQAVYNWQYVNSLRLWVDLLGATTDKPQLQPLIYPLVTIALGVVRLVPTAQYFPLRFHCLQVLITLCKETHTYVPVLPLILEVLRSKTFNSKHSAVSMRPLQFTCILRLNKTQLAENGFRDEVVEQVVSLTLEFLAHESASLAFSDLVVPTVVALKAYLKDCRNANYSRKLKQLLDKIQENARFMDQQRNKITFGLKDTAQLQAWETQLRNKGTPLGIYYDSWVKMHEVKKRRQASQADTINSDYDLPTLKRPAKRTNGVELRNEKGEVELFPSDSEDDDDLPDLPVGDEDKDEDDVEAPSATKGKKAKKQQKKQKKQKKSAKSVDVDVPFEEPDGDDGVDIVKELDLNDW